MAKLKKKLKFSDLSNAWQRFRSQTGMSQVELATLLKIQQSTISHYEYGGRCPEPRIAKRFVELAKRHKVRMSMDELYAQMGQ